MGGCQHKYGPFWGPKYSVPYYNEDPKRDPTIDNHPYKYMLAKYMYGNQVLELNCPSSLSTNCSAKQNMRLRIA